jgi:Na+-translocating ferredoxin:NAD+ oxidoreductase RnfC subunit
MITLTDIQNNGIIGAGGAGFPTHVKLNSKPEFLIMNAAECEPLLHKDKELLLNYTDEVLNGFQIAMQLTGARQGIIGIKEKHKALIKLIRSKAAENTDVIAIGDFYPAGDEVTLIYLTTGRIIQPGTLPISVGCVVQNVETLYNLAQDRPVTDTFVTVAGAVDKPATLKIPVGTHYTDILTHFEIQTRNYRIRSGGLMMGTLETGTDQVVTKYSSGIIVLPANHHCVTTWENYRTPEQTDRRAKAACDQCNYCTEYCPRYLLGHPVRPETAMRNRMFNTDDRTAHLGNKFCCECNLCTFFACPEGLDPKGATVIEKQLLRDEKWEGLPVKPHPMMEYRKVPTKKLMQRLDVLQFQDKAPLSDLLIQPKQVRIPLKQHIGAPAIPQVDQGQSVARGQCIAKPDGDISSAIHASMDGIVEAVNNNEIVIRG